MVLASADKQLHRYVDILNDVFSSSLVCQCYVFHDEIIMEQCHSYVTISRNGIVGFLHSNALNLRYGDTMSKQSIVASCSNIKGEFNKRIDYIVKIKLYSGLTMEKDKMYAIPMV